MTRTYLLRARRIADNWGLVTNGKKPMKFKSLASARKYGREVLGGNRFIASWETISLTNAIKAGYIEMLEQAIKNSTL